MNKVAILILIATMLHSCSENDIVPPSGNGNGNVPVKVINGWSVSLEKVLDAVGKDVIPAIENSVLITADIMGFS